jgi:hypothetical protein
MRRIYISRGAPAISDIHNNKKQERKTPSHNIDHLSQSVAKLPDHDCQSFRFPLQDAEERIDLTTRSRYFQVAFGRRRFSFLCPIESESHPTVKIRVRVPAGFRVRVLAGFRVRDRVGMGDRVPAGFRFRVPD